MSPAEPQLPPRRPALEPRIGVGAHSLAGRVTDASGQPVAGATVAAQRELGPGVDAMPDHGIDTDPVVVAVANPAGEFLLQGLDAGRYRLTIEGPDLVTAELRFVDVPGTDLRIFVAREVSVIGVVEGGDAEVWLRAESGGEPIHLSSDSGRFHFGSIPEGGYILWAIAAETAAPARRIERFGGGAFAEERLVLQPAETVIGQVVDRSSGRGVAALVALRVTEGLEEARFAAAAADGTFRVPGILPGEWIAEARAQGYVADELVRFESGVGRSLELTLLPGAMLSGIVVDGAGTPVAGAVVSATGTDEDGGPRSYPAGASAVAKGVPTSSRLLPLGELGVLLGPIPYPPPPGAGLPLVAAPLGGGAPGASAAMALPAPTAALTQVSVTGSDGQFRLTGIVGGAYRVAAEHPKYATSVSEPGRLAHGGARTVRLTLHPGGSLAGRIVDERGFSLLGATVRAVDSAGREVFTVTDADGRFELQRLHGELEISVEAVGHAPMSRRLSLTDEAVERFDATLTDADERLSGRVVDIAGFAVAGAFVRIAGRTAVGRVGIVTDASGHFSIDSIPPGAHNLEVSHPEFPTWKGRAQADEALTVTLPFGGGIGGRVLDSHSRSGIANARVTASAPENSARSVIADELGGFELSGLPAGIWSLEARAQGFSTGRAEVDVEKGWRRGALTARGVVVELARGARLAGVVRDENGDRASGARVWAGAASATADTDGHFSLAEAPSGKIVLRAEKGDRAGNLELTVSPGEQRVTLEVRVAPLDEEETAELDDEEEQ